MSDIPLTGRFREIHNKREEIFEKWNAAYRLIQEEVTSLISAFDDIERISNPQFQDLTIKFYSIHLCNFFYFHVRKLLVEKNRTNDTAKLLTNGFSNSSNTPSCSVMCDLLSYLVNDERKIRDLSEDYKKVYELRNKFAHGASSETVIPMTMNEYKRIFEEIQSLI